MLFILSPLPFIVWSIGVYLSSKPFAHVSFPVPFVAIPIVVVIHTVAFFITVAELPFVTFVVGIPVFAFSMPHIVLVQSFMPISFSIHGHPISISFPVAPLPFVCAINFGKINAVPMKYVIFKLAKVVVSIHEIDSGLITYF